MSCVGLLAAAFGPNYTYVLLRLVYGQKWSNTEAPAALACYCGYITLLALNGCTEAYVNAVADTRLEHHLWHVRAATNCMHCYLPGVCMLLLQMLGTVPITIFPGLVVQLACRADVLSRCSHTLAAMRVVAVSQSALCSCHV